MAWSEVQKRVAADCGSGAVGREFLQRAKLEVADTLCSIGSLNMSWSEKGNRSEKEKYSLVREAAKLFFEARMVSALFAILICFVFSQTSS